MNRFFSLVGRSILTANGEGGGGDPDPEEETLTSFAKDMSTPPVLTTGDGSDQVLATIDLGAQLANAAYLVVWSGGVQLDLDTGENFTVRLERQRDAGGWEPLAGHGICYREAVGAPLLERMEVCLSAFSRYTDAGGVQVRLVASITAATPGDTTFTEGTALLAVGAGTLTIQ